MRYCFSMKDKQLKDARIFGGKAANLAVLSGAGMNVPHFFVVGTGCFDEFMNMNPEIGGAPDAEKGAMIKSAEMPVKIADEIIRTAASCGLMDEFTAVRSSAIGEDSADASFAGQMDTFLFVKGGDAIVNAVKKCWASLYSERIITYRKEKNFVLGQLKTAVVVQKMVKSESSCVIFTYDTVGRCDDIIINSVFGQGEGLVSGRIEADTFVADRGGAVKKELIADKGQKIDFAEGGGTAVFDLPEGLSVQKSLSLQQVKELTAGALKIEKLFGVPQDIEAAVSGGKIFFLQARPITWPRPDNRIIWDNSNITESYAGVTTPFTFSFIRELYNIVYQQFVRTVGVTEGRIRENEEIFRNMLGLINGEVYYNLRSWYGVIMMLPGYEQNKVFMEQMMGVKEKFGERPHKSSGSIAERLKGFMEVFSIAARFGWHFIRIDKRVEDFRRNFDSVFPLYKDRDFNNDRPWEIMEQFFRVKQKLVWNWQAPILTDFFAMIFYGSLKNAVIKWGIDPSGTLQNDLLCGQGDVESTLPVKAAVKIADLARSEKRYMDLFSAEPDDKALLSRIRSGDFGPLRETVEAYLNDYGFRGVNELKIEEPSLSDKPEFLIGIIRNYLSVKGTTFEEMSKHEDLIKNKAEQKAADCISRSGFFTAAFRKTLFSFLLKNARKHIKNRESMRFARSKIYNIVRKMSRALGSQFAGEGIIENAGDIYYLDINEIFGYMKGTCFTADLKGIIALRKKEFGSYRDRNNLKDRIETRGFVYKGNELDRPKASAAGGLLKGIACSPGIVRGKVRVILDPHGDTRLSGEILVTKRTDPGWVTFYPAVSGLIIEKGSILSHSAIVAREMGLPAVVGISGLIDSVKDGMTVEVNGTEGTVRIIGEAE